jgi:hypothetical protein
MSQAALSFENGKSNHRYNNNGGGTQPLGSVTEDHLAKGTQPAFAKPSDKEENELVASMVEDEGKIVVSWPLQLNDILEEDELCSKEEFLTGQQKKEREAAASPSAGNANKVSVMDCIAKYCETEQLDESDMWYCNRCKDHVRAWKQFHLYRTPPILIIHLKRFHYSSTTHRRDKIDTHIDFPLEDLDLRQVVRHWEEGAGLEPLYDCYAVSNHFGGLGGGHYTAYARGDDGSWYNFDDSRVTSGVEESEVVSSAAYCLYYKRKDVATFTKDNDSEDDVVMTKADDDGQTSGDAHFDRGMMTAMPVSPSPCNEDSGEPPNFRSDVMEVDNTRDDISASSAASYRTPVASLNDGTDDGMDDDGDNSNSAVARPVPEDELFFDLQ